MSSEKSTSQQPQDAARQAMADFLANMSHEIRTPLNAIIGMAYLVLQSELKPQQRENVAKIEAAGQHLLGIVNDMLDYTRLEAGDIVFSRSAFSPTTLLEETLRRFADKALAKRLTIAARVETSVPVQLIGDPQRIGQIIRLYLDNAIKFTEKGDVAIVMRAEPVKPGSPSICRLHCAVRDSGIGLSEAQRSELFQAFRQGDGSSTRKFGGTGLGLAIARKLAECMGGEVGVDSIPGKGSNFRFAAELEVAADTPLLQEEYRLVIDAPAATKAEQTTARVDQQRLATVCARLMSLLADDDAEAAEVFAENVELLRTAWPDEFPRMEQAIRVFDFALATSMLEKACDNG
ncbi:MAG: ATP-binding protein [Sterolibacterium sp.]